MKIHKNIGSKERLFEMFENVNNINLKEWYDDDYYNKPSQPKGIGDFNNVDWKVLFDGLIKNEQNLNNPSQTWNVNDLTDYDGMLSPEELDGLLYFNIIEIIDKTTPILGQYKGYNEFYNKAKEIWNKDRNSETPDPEEKIFSAMQEGVGESKTSLKENNSIEIGTDSGIFHQLYSYISRNLLSNNEFNVGELKIHIEAEPTTWEDVPYRSATQMQPEEGGYPEDVNGKISDIVIWDREDNEYILSQDALDKLNTTVRGFDGDLYDELAEKAANVSKEDEYSRADFARKGELENEGVIKENKSEDINQEVYDEFDMRYLQSSRSIPFDEIIDVGETYGIGGELASQIAMQVITDNQSKYDEEFKDNIKDYIKRLQDNNVNYHNYSEQSIWEAFEEEYNEGSGFEEFKEKWDKLTKDPNQIKMFGESDNSNKTITYSYNDKGIFIPKGYEDKKIGIMSIEVPAFSGNEVISVVEVNDDGSMGNVYSKADDWSHAKAKLEEIL